MGKTSKLFLSYSRKDDTHAKALQKALTKIGLPVWQDVQSIKAGERWADAIEKGIQDARAIIVLISSSSANSHWVIYEYAFATGAKIPGVAVVIKGTEVPGPIQRFQVVHLTTAKDAAQQIADGIRTQSRSLAQERATTPQLVAKFQEFNGALRSIPNGKLPAYWIDLWIEHAPRQTRYVAFEILDLGFRDRKWKVHNQSAQKSLRAFLTDDMNSYGDIEIWARGVGPGIGSWSTITTLYEALLRYYSGRETTTEVRRALKQIREN
ncbi:MAG: toll/interleukin-1 receptor domain-containing protein [Nitrospira sp.]|nr:toll/interleukin-1 receptor domain-containing protein [Nitrospira sp.]